MADRRYYTKTNSFLSGLTTTIWRLTPDIEPIFRQVTSTAGSPVITVSGGIEGIEVGAFVASVGVSYGSDSVVISLQPPNQLTMSGNANPSATDANTIFINPSDGRFVLSSDGHDAKLVKTGLGTYLVTDPNPFSSTFIRRWLQLTANEDNGGAAISFIPSRDGVVALDGSGVAGGTITARYPVTQYLSVGQRVFSNIVPYRAGVTITSILSETQFTVSEPIFGSLYGVATDLNCYSIIPLFYNGSGIGSAFANSPAQQYMGYGVATTRISDNATRSLP